MFTSKLNQYRVVNSKVATFATAISDVHHMWWVKFYFTTSVVNVEVVASNLHYVPAKHGATVLAIGIS